MRHETCATSATSWRWPTSALRPRGGAMLREPADALGPRSASSRIPRGRTRRAAAEAGFAHRDRRKDRRAGAAPAAGSGRDRRGREDGPRSARRGAAARADSRPWDPTCCPTSSGSCAGALPRLKLLLYEYQTGPLLGKLPRRRARPRHPGAAGRRRRPRHGGAVRRALHARVPANHPLARAIASGSPTSRARRCSCSRTGTA